MSCRKKTQQLLRLRGGAGHQLEMPRRQQELCGHGGRGAARAFRGIPIAGWLDGWMTWISKWMSPHFGQLHVWGITK